MKKIHYTLEFRCEADDMTGAAESVTHQPMFLVCRDSALDAAISFAKREAYNGEYTIEDDGQPEPPPTTEQRVSALEEQLAQSDETAISLYEAQEAQEVINAQQDEALMEIYEMIG